jgi:hypothetical protein
MSPHVGRARRPTWIGALGGSVSPSCRNAAPSAQTALPKRVAKFDQLHSGQATKVNAAFIKRREGIGRGAAPPIIHPKRPRPSRGSAAGQPERTAIARHPPALIEDRLSHGRRETAARAGGCGSFPAAYERGPVSVRRRAVGGSVKMLVAPPKREPENSVSGPPRLLRLGSMVRCSVAPASQRGSCRHGVLFVVRGRACSRPGPEATSASRLRACSSPRASNTALAKSSGAGSCKSSVARSKSASGGTNAMRTNAAMKARGQPCEAHLIPALPFLGADSGARAVGGAFGEVLGFGQRNRRPG